MYVRMYVCMYVLMYASYVHTTYIHIHPVPVFCPTQGMYVRTCVYFLNKSMILVCVRTPVGSSSLRNRPVSSSMIPAHMCYLYIPFILDTLGLEETVLIMKVSSFQGLKMCYG